MKDELIPSSVAPLLNYFKNLIPLNDKEIALVSSYFKPRLYRKRQYVLQEGDLCNQMNFVIRGCLRMYKIDDKGNTHIVQFATENGWTTDIGSFHGRNPSALNIDALEDTMVLQISHENLITLYPSAPKFDRIFRVLIENSYVSLQKRMLQSISSTAEERYQLFLNYSRNRFNVLLRNVYFGPVDEATNLVDYAQTFSGKVVSDLSLGYEVSKNLRWTIGANNLFDIYPDQIRADSPVRNDDIFLYARTGQQFGYTGRHIFTRLTLSLK